MTPNARGVQQREGIVRTSPVSCRLVSYLLRLTAALTAAAALPVANAESLQSICDRLENLEKSRAYRKGVDECRQIGDHDSPTVAGEKKHPTIQERYLADRANLLHDYGETQRKVDDRKALAHEALLSWIDYFSWFSELEDSDQRAVIGAYRDKLYAAAAGLGIAALDAEEPKEAWSRYEKLSDAFFNRKSVRLWLAALLYPKQPVPVDEMIFSKTASDENLLKQLSQDDRAEHSRSFYERMQHLEAAKKGLEDLMDKLKPLFPPKPKP